MLSDGLTVGSRLGMSGCPCWCCPETGGNIHPALREDATLFIEQPIQDMVQLLVRCCGEGGSGHSGIKVYEPEELVVHTKHNHSNLQ